MVSSSKISVTLNPAKRHMPLIIATAETAFAIALYLVTVFVIFPYLHGKLKMFIPNRYSQDYHGVFNVAHFSSFSLVFLVIVAAAWLAAVVFSWRRNDPRMLLMGVIVHGVSFLYAGFFLPNVLGDIVISQLWGVFWAIGLILPILVYGALVYYVLLRVLVLGKNKPTQ